MADRDLRVTNAIDTAIRQHGEATYPHECCGALVGRDGVGDGRAQTGFESEPAMRVELVLRRPLATGHDDRHLVQSLRDRAAEPHVGADALDEIAEVGASQQGVEGTAQAGAARA